MTPKSLSSLFTLLILVATFVLFADALGEAGGLGGWQRIENLNDPEVQDVAKYAVTEHNKQAGTDLKFQKVVRGETQVVSGVNYRLEIAAKDGAGGSGRYRAVVWVKPWQHFKNLTSFEKI
ncbi:hypothetical protein NMG60_11022555 [Bertholletia excelsa]